MIGMFAGRDDVCSTAKKTRSTGSAFLWTDLQSDHSAGFVTDCTIGVRNGRRIS
jgi:hypothetical protein